MIPLEDQSAPDPQFLIRSSSPVEIYIHKTDHSAADTVHPEVINRLGQRKHIPNSTRLIPVVQANFTPGVGFFFPFGDPRTFAGLGLLICHGVLGLMYTGLAPSRRQSCDCGPASLINKFG